MFCIFAANYQTVTMETENTKAGCKSTQLISISSESSSAKKSFERTESEIRFLMNGLNKILKCRCLALRRSFSCLPDPREHKGRQYGIHEIMFGGLSLFLFKAGSRNQLNNNRSDGYFSANYHRLFGMKLPHSDPVNAVLRELPNNRLEQVKMDMMSGMFEQKWLRDYRLLNRYYLVAVDATGIVSFDRPHCAHCLTKKSKNGQITYFHYVLEAKLVTRDGHALSLATEWIENPAGEFDKQDCERKAFIRLAEKLKKQYPRLPVCILADGLYPYENAFEICEANHWKFIFVLQDRSLKTVQEELILPRRNKPSRMYYTTKKGWDVAEEYRFETDIDYHDRYTLNWIQCIETRKKNNRGKTTMHKPPPQTSRFEYVTNIQPDRDSVREIGTAGRLRWKIENEGFNIQKCGDYELEHKYDRNSYNALKNYYTLLQMAHIINQLTEKENCITDILKQRPKETIRNLWRKLIAYMIFRQPSTSNNADKKDYEIPPAPT
jgi:hypothetical protein